MKFPVTFAVFACLASVGAAEVTDVDRDAYLEEWQTMLPLVARNLEYCLFPEELAELCGVLSVLREGTEDGLDEHFLASVFVVATFNNAFAPIGDKYVSDLECLKPKVEGGNLTPIMISSELNLVVKASDSSCYLDILEEPYAS